MLVVAWVPDAEIGHHSGPLSPVFLRLPSAQACPLLSVLPPRLSPELYLQLAVHIFDVTELPRLMSAM